MGRDRPDRGSLAGRLPRLPWEAGVGILGLVAALLAYFAARYALEVLLALVALGIVVALQRTVMDTLRDLLGAGTVNVALGAVALIGLWYVLGSDDGRRAAGELLAAADRRGFKTLWVDVSGLEVPAPAVRVPPSGGGAAAPGGAGPQTVSPSVRQPSLVGGSAAPAPRPVGGSSGGAGSTTPRSASGVATSGSAGSAGAGGGEGRARRAARQAATLQMRLMTPRPVAGQYVTVRVEAVSRSDEAPGGSVELSIDGVPLGSRSLDWWGRVDFTIQDLSAGSYRVSARLDSDGWAASREAITVTVAPGAP